VSNELATDAPAQAVWNCLIQAVAWPEWYPNSSDVRLLDEKGENLRDGTRFRWKTFGMKIECTVEEFVPYERLAWSSKSFGMSVYHAWLISPRDGANDGSCHVLTEETQNGFIPQIAKYLMPGQMHKQHQIWLEQLAIRASE